MTSPPLIEPTPWDAAALGMPTWEVLEYSEIALQQAVDTVGHHTIKVEPLSDKRMLELYGFYYCDTLIEPFCKAGRLRATHHPYATTSKAFKPELLLTICHGSFIYGRFQRDFNLDIVVADIRYANWLNQLIENQQVYGLFWQSTLVGFIGYVENNLVLHAIGEKYRGKGLSKYWWSDVCNKVIEMGFDEVRSSISATNVAVVNLYASLGFSFRNPKDVYHRLVL